MSIYSIIYNTEIRFLDLNTHKSLIILMIIALIGISIL